jgi:SPP1 gp7 family putative phage head morphogenesis protein
MPLDLQPLPPREAIDYLKAKGFEPSFDWRDVYAEEHARAFTVAKMMRVDLLQTVHEHLVQALEQGKSLRDFAAELTPLLKREGWWGKQEMTDPLTGERRNVQLGSPWRLQTIYDVNLRTAYSAGRWQRAQRSRAVLPYLVYRSMRDARVRPAHARWNGTLLPQDHPWWDTHYPPNGWRCRCLAYPLSEADAADYPDAQRGDPSTETTRWVNPRTGEARDVPVGIDPGFDYHPGKAANQQAVRLLAGKEQQIQAVISGPPPAPRRSVRDVRNAGVDYVLTNGRPLQARRIEFAYAYDGTGNVVLQKRGVASAVEFTADEVATLKQAKDVVMIHNHPSGGSLSDADFRFAGSVGLKAIQAIGHNDIQYEGAMRDPALFAAKYSSYDRRIQDYFWPLVTAGTITREQAQLWHTHGLNRVLAAAGAVRYRVLQGAAKLRPTPAIARFFSALIKEVTNGNPD